MNISAFNLSTAICRSIPGLILALHLLLLLVLSRISPSDAKDFAALCLAWPIVVPVALGFNIAAFAHIFRAGGGYESSRRVSLAIAIISIVSTSICGLLVGFLINALDGVGNRF
jgi:hypothetical protein